MTIDSNLMSQPVGAGNSPVQGQEKMGQRSVRRESKQYIPHMWLQTPNRELSPQEKSVYKAIKWVSASADRMNQVGVFRLGGARETEAKLNASIVSGTLDLTNVSSNDKHSVICALKAQFVKGNFDIMPECFNKKTFNRLTDLVKEGKGDQVIEYLREALKNNIVAQNYLLLNQEVSRFSESNKMHSDNLGRILTPALIKGFIDSVKDPKQQSSLFANNTLAKFMIEHADEICLPEQVEIIENPSSSSGSSSSTPPSSPEVLATTPPDSLAFINPADPKGKEKAVETPVHSVQQKTEPKRVMAEEDITDKKDLFIKATKEFIRTRMKMLKEPNVLMHQSDYHYLFKYVDAELFRMFMGIKTGLQRNPSGIDADLAAWQKIMNILSAIPDNSFCGK